MNEILNSKKGPWWNGSFWSVGLCLLFLIFSLSGCKDDDRALLGEEGEDALQLGAGITGLTRATDAGFEVGDTLGLFAVKWKSEVEQDTLLAAGNYADNVWFRLESMDNNWTPERTIYFPNDDRLLDLYAYYPYRTPAFGTGTVIPVSVEANQSVGNCYTRSDFMVARTSSVKRTREKVPLIFDHMLAQMNFVLKPGAGFTLDDLLTAKIKVVNAVVDGTYDLSDIVWPEVVTGTKRSDVVPAGSWSKGAGVLTGKLAIVIPQELTPQTYIEVSLGNRRFTYKPSSVQLNPGCSREFTITVNNTGLDITTQINPWDNCPPVNGDADEEFEEEPIVLMVTTKTDPSFACTTNGDIEIDWGDGIRNKNTFSHTYSDGLSEHKILMYGKEDALTRLDCYTNKLASLDVSKNTALTYLNCNTNKLASLDVSKNTALTQLYCSTNNLTSLDVSKNTALKQLYCNNNNLTSLDVSKNTALIQLSCYTNKLASLDVSKNTALTELYCNTNNLTSLDVSKNTTLTNLNCNTNNLTSLDVSKNTALTHLHCYTNKLASLDISKNTALAYLTCYANNLTSLDVSKNTALIQLYCHTNNLTSLDVSKNTVLTQLYCNNTPLVNDKAVLINLANSLCDRAGSTTGMLYINNTVSKSWINDICVAKNWRVG